MPQVRKRRCQTSSMSLSTVAFTTALSKLSETSSTERIITIHSARSMLATTWPWLQPYHAASAKQTMAKRIGPRKWRSMLGPRAGGDSRPRRRQGDTSCDTCDSVQEARNQGPEGRVRVWRGGHRAGHGQNRGTDGHV